MKKCIRQFISREDYSYRDFYKKYGDHFVVDLRQKPDMELKASCFYDYKWDTSWRNIGHAVPVVNLPDKALKKLNQILERAKRTHRDVFFISSGSKPYDSVIRKMLEGAF